jgi:acetylornithine/N-succinyldiaminopimelate aminotransferase
MQEKNMQRDNLDALMRVADRPPQVFVSGSGSWLFDETGKRYLDFVQGWAVNCLGHCPPELTQAINEQAQRLVNCSPAFFNEPSARLAALIAAHSCFDQVFFCNSGAEANEGAIKLARKWGAKNRGGAFEIVTFDNAFHGRTLATMSASGKPQWAQLFEPKVGGFPKAPFGNLDAVAKLIGERTAAVMLEPVQGEAGVIPATPELMQGLRALTRERGVLLIVDEIQTGMGRTGKLFGYEHYAIEPDIMTLGKGLGGGVPLAALAAREAVCCFEPGDQGGTFNGNPLMTAVGCAVMQALLAPGFLDGVARKGSYLRLRLEQLAAKRGLGEVRGKGLLLALELGADAGPQLVERARDRGLLLNSPRPSVLRFMPALNVDDADIDTVVAQLDALLEEGRDG